MGMLVKVLMVPEAGLGTAIESENKSLASVLSESVLKSVLEVYYNTSR